MGSGLWKITRIKLKWRDLQFWENKSFWMGLAPRSVFGPGGPVGYIGICNPEIVYFGFAQTCNSFGENIPKPALPI